MRHQCGCSGAGRECQLSRVCCLLEGLGLALYQSIVIHRRISLHIHMEKKVIIKMKPNLPLSIIKTHTTTSGGSP